MALDRKSVIATLGDRVYDGSDPRARHYFDMIGDTVVGKYAVGPNRHCDYPDLEIYPVVPEPWVLVDADTYFATALGDRCVKGCYVKPPEPSRPKRTDEWLVELDARVRALEVMVAVVPVAPDAAIADTALDAPLAKEG